MEKDTGESKKKYCKKILEKVRKKSINHDLLKYVQEIKFEIFVVNVRTYGRDMFLTRVQIIVFKK